MKVSRPTRNVFQLRALIEAEEVYTREVKKIGNGAKIDFVKRLIGKKVLVVVMKDGK